MGLFLGLAVSATVGLAGVIAYMAGGRGNVQVAANPSPLPSYNDQQLPPSAPAVLSAPVDDSKDHILGPKDAKVTLVEYSDFECPFCKRHLPAVKQILQKYPKDVRLVYRHYPLSFHPTAEPAAIASECAAKVGGNDAFWKMHDKMFDRNTELTNDNLKAMAKEVGLKEADFNKCFDNKETLNLVNEDVASGNDSGVEGTPATFVNGKLVSGAVPFATLEAEVVAAGAKQ